MNEKEKIWFDDFAGSVLLHFCFGFCAGAGAKNKFVKASNGNVYYYNAQGKKAKGLVTVNGKKYYFASNGVQRTGWRCVKKKYYFFRQAGRCRRIHEEIYEGKWHPSEKERYSLI